MHVKSRSKVLWELFATIHPVLVQALPGSAHEVDCDRITKNRITMIRHGIRAILFEPPNDELEFTTLDNAAFFESLHSLLEIVETFVSSKMKDAILSECADVSVFPS